MHHLAVIVLPERDDDVFSGYSFLCQRTPVSCENGKRAYNESKQSHMISSVHENPPLLSLFTSSIPHIIGVYPLLLKKQVL
jgi:hypothetical protein